MITLEGSKSEVLASYVAVHVAFGGEVATTVRTKERFVGFTTCEV